ncbi:MAG TPA: DUF1175 domain-containing protein [Bryobacteraceae bacterium]|nr:DUF1175 domain-containing protein [Bryobacteraceae bacterium]
MTTRTRAALVAISAAAAAVVVISGGVRSCGLPAPRLALAPAQIVSDGYDSATLVIESAAGGTPFVSVVGNTHVATIENVTGAPGRWQAHIRAGVLPGRVHLRVAFRNAPAVSTELESVLFRRDTAQDGTPDFLRLDDPRDRAAFRRWFTWLAEAQYFQPPAARPAEIKDCAALIRYAYREALHAHDSAWAATAGIPPAPPFDSAAKYQYPFTPLGAALFRVREGPFEPADLTAGAFGQFADVRALYRLNTHLVSRVLSAALPGDLLFFRQESGAEPYHSMIYLGESQFQNDGRRYVLYHTGPTGSDPGEIRRPAVEELMHFPRPEWRPIPSNPNFLGVSRWNILRKENDTHPQ